MATNPQPGAAGATQTDNLKLILQELQVLLESISAPPEK
jgi:hypothetical protein